MKLIAIIDIRQYRTDVKGDDMIDNLIEHIDTYDERGWEVNNVSIDRKQDVLKDASEPLRKCNDMVKAMIADGDYKVKVDFYQEEVERLTRLVDNTLKEQQNEK